MAASVRSSSVSRRRKFHPCTLPDLQSLHQSMQNPSLRCKCNCNMRKPQQAYLEIWVAQGASHICSIEGWFDAQALPIAPLKLLIIVSLLWGLVVRADGTGLELANHRHALPLHQKHTEGSSCACGMLCDRPGNLQICQAGIAIATLPRLPTCSQAAHHL